MSLLQLSYTQVKSAPVNVLCFGAKGDGTTDDSAAINAAIAASNGEVYFPAGTYLCSITSSKSGLVLKGESRYTTILKNNSVSSALIKLDGAFTTVSDFSLDNNLVPANTVWFLGTYQVLERIVIQNHGNASVLDKFAVHYDGATISSISDVACYDTDQTYGGALLIEASYYSTITNFSSGRAGTNANQYAVKVSATAGICFTNLYLEEGGGNGLMRVINSTGITFTNFSSELFASRLPLVADKAFITLNTCSNINFAGGYVSYQTASSTTVVPIFNATTCNGVTLQDMYFNRSVNSASALIISTGTSNNITLSNLTAKNTVSIADSTAVAYTICDIASGSNVNINNVYSTTAGATAVVSDMANMEIGFLSGVTVSGAGTASYNSDVFSPSFLALASAAQNNITGDNTVALVIFEDQIFDLNSNYNIATGIFISPTKSKFQINTTIGLTGLDAAHTSCVIRIATGRRTYNVWSGNPYALSAGGAISISSSIISELFSGDQVYVTVTVTGGTKVVDLNAGQCFFSACLLK
jgi:hypothetical protein